MKCQQCGKEFEKRRSGQSKYCSKECFNQHRKEYQRNYKQSEQYQKYANSDRYKNMQKGYRRDYELRHGWIERILLTDEEKRQRRNARVRAWHKTIPGQLAARARRIMRRSRERNVGGRVKASDIKLLQEKQDNKCAYCGKHLDKYHVDHIKPISKGGTNDINNLALSCPECNLRKSNKDLDDFLKNSL